MNRELFDGTPYDLWPLDPARSGRTARSTRRKMVLLAQGIHPVTRLPLLDRVTQCRDCVFVVHNGRYIKCAKNMTHGMATDLRLWYPACIAFKKPKKTRVETIDTGGKL